MWAGVRAKGAKENPMRILIAGDYPADARLGSSKVAYKLCSAFRALGHFCQTLFEDDLGTKVIPSRLRWLAAPWVGARAVLRTMASQGPFDIVDVSSAEGFPIAALRRAKRLGATTVISRSHGLEHLNYQRMLKDHDEGLLQKPWHKRLYYPAVRMSQVGAAAILSDGLIVLNQNDAAFARQQRWQPEDRVAVIPHGVSEAFVSAQNAEETPSRGGLLFCGSWTDVKGVAYLAQAFNLLVSEEFKTPLWVVGGGVEESRIRACFTDAANILLNIVPRCSESEVMAHYRTRELLIFPSTYEGFGMVVLEAMSQGLPVISTPVGAAAQFVRHLETGLIVPPRDPVSIANAVKLLSQDAPLRSRISIEGKRSVHDRTWSKTAQDTLAFYGHCSRRDVAPRSAGKHVIAQPTPGSNLEIKA